MQKSHSALLIAWYIVGSLLRLVNRWLLKGKSSSWLVRSKNDKELEVLGFPSVRDKVETMI